MKKTIFLPFLVALVSVFTASAQENTYSIIVKMQNGTVLTIGPNEADSIFFDEGKLNVSGKSIEDILKIIDEDSKHLQRIDESIDMLHTVTKALQTVVDYKVDQKSLEPEIAKIVGEKLQNIINDLQAIANGKVDQKTLDTEIAKVAGRIDAIDTNLNQLTEGIAEVATLKGQVESNKKETTEAIEALRSDIAGQLDIIENFKQDIIAKLGFLGDENPINTINDLKKRNEAMEERIAQLEAIISELQNR